MRFRGFRWLAALSLTGCLMTPGKDGRARAEDEIRVDGEYVARLPVAPEGWPAIVWPKDNPYRPDKAVLGRRLFFDARLGRDRAVSCAWCHAPVAAFSDKHHTPTSTGVFNRGIVRNPPTLANVAFLEEFTFDGGVHSLEEQALIPLFHRDEMDMTEEEIVARLEADTLYPRLFRAAFGSDGVTLDRVAKALATYQRGLISHDSPYDRWAAGDSAALGPGARRGATLFFGKADCARCHVPPLFTDGRYHNIGLPVQGDSGHARITRQAGDLGKLRTPTLRNVWGTAPYLHDGSMPTLRDVVRHYDSGGGTHPNRDPLLRPLGLTHHEIEDLVEFLESLTGMAIFAETNP